MRVFRALYPVAVCAEELVLLAAGQYLPEDELAATEAAQPVLRLLPAAAAVHVVYLQSARVVEAAACALQPEHGVYRLPHLGALLPAVFPHLAECGWFVGHCCLGTKKGEDAPRGESPPYVRSGASTRIMNL